MAPNPAAGASDSLRLDGENLTLIHCAVDGVSVDAVPDATGLTLAHVPLRPFVLTTEVEISPQTNTAL